MSKFQPIDGRIGGQDIAVNSTSQGHQLGLCVKAVDMAATDYGVGEFIYAKGAASTVIGSFVIINEDDYSTTLLGANASGKVGVAMAATVAAQFGWYQICGKAVGKAGAAYADNALVYATATGGQVDDAVVIGDRVKKAKGASAVGTPSAGLAEFEISYPFSDDGAAS